MSAAKEQVARLLAIVPLIRRRGTMHVDDAARALGTTSQQLVQDLRTLVFCGWPGLYPGDLIEVDLDAFGEGGDGMIRISNAEYLTGPVRLSPAEASAVTVALHTLRETADEATTETIDRALEKLAVAGGRGAGEVGVHLPEEDPALVALRERLQDAVDTGRQVRMTYHVPARDENTERTVDPLELQRMQGHDYLAAWCHDARDRRMFRLDRIVAAEVLTEPAARHDAAQAAGGLLAPGEDATTVTLRLQPPARWVAEYHPVLARLENADGSLDVDLAVADPRWLVRLLLRLAPHAEVISHPELARSFERAAADALSLYGVSA